MSEKDFEPLTSQLGIAGTSYRLQLGLINEKWASRLMKGRDTIIDSYIYDNVEGITPNGNRIVSWVLKTVAIPNINPHQIMKTTQFLLRQARENKDKKKVIIPIQEAKEAQLEKVPESELKRPRTQGWVKEELSEREKFLQRTKARAVSQKHYVEKESTMQEKSPEIISTEKELPKIPSKDAAETEKLKEQALGKIFCP
ncbi:MAG: hypothetical protein KAX33_05085, partial [Candidatus Lokiarchaeota archaeon]|nr:hypothetical protein [Candidatus Lokiarchaeota archaeon]